MKHRRKETLEHICQLCATQVTTNVPHSTPAGSHPLLSAVGSRAAWECTVGVRNAGCLPHMGRWILHSWRWERGDGQHQKTKRCEVSVIYINSTSITSSEVPRQASGYMLYGSQSSKSLFHRKKYSSASFLVYVAKHCGLAGSVQEEIHPMWPSYTDSPVAGD